jgi:hypothetical protein
VAAGNTVTVIHHLGWLGLDVVSVASKMAKTEQLAKITLDGRRQQCRAQWLDSERSHAQEFSMVRGSRRCVPLQGAQDPHEQGLDGCVPTLDLEGHCGSYDPIRWF